MEDSTDRQSLQLPGPHQGFWLMFLSLHETQDYYCFFPDCSFLGCLDVVTCQKAGLLVPWHSAVPLVQVPGLGMQGQSHSVLWGLGSQGTH